MNIEIEVNGQIIKARKGEMLLDALKANGIHVPTLCHLEGFKPSGACRICVVEAEGRQDLIPACSFPAEEWMKIKTHSSRVIKARRTILELLLSCHSGGCLYCDRNQTCELQKLASELNVGEHRFSTGRKRKKMDTTSQSVLRDPSKCVLCGRCVRVCEEVEEVAALDFLRRGSRTEVGTVLDKGLNYSSCVNCGQCILVCPSGALQDKSHVDQAIQALQDPKKYTVAIIDPALKISLSEQFGYRSGQEFTSLLATALRRIGFKKVYSSAWGNEFETGLLVTEFEKKLDEKNEGPLFTATCPSFVRYLEQNRQDLLPSLISIRPGRQIMTHLLKAMLSAQNNLPASGIQVIYLTACTAAKGELHSPDRMRHPSFYPDIVLTSREVYKLIRLFGTQIDKLNPEYPEDLFGTDVRSGYLHAQSGGSLEAAIRILQVRKPELAVQTDKLARLKGSKEVKECSFDLDGESINVTAISGLSQFESWMKESKSKKKRTHLVEVMACPFGCINGGGQPIGVADRNLKARSKAVAEMDELYSGVEQRGSVCIPFDFQWGDNELNVDYSSRPVIR
jgi:NADH dehydrogenase/NADH:ubiquinone oxidoreductase subunit G